MNNKDRAMQVPSPGVNRQVPFNNYAEPETNNIQALETTP
jgi:hypothetical protein